MLAQLHRGIHESQRAAFAVGTYKNLRLQWRTFISFCMYFHLAFLPTSLQTVCLYAQFLSRTFKSVDSIRNYLLGVKTFHILCGFPFVHLDNIECRLLLKGLANLKMHKVRRAAPITPAILAAFLPLLDLSSPFDAACWSAFLLAFFTMARKANMVPTSLKTFDFRKQLARRNVFLGKDGLLVVFPWSKTNQSGSRNVMIPVSALNNSTLCPVRAYENLISLVHLRDFHPAFTFQVVPRVKCLTAYLFVKKLRSLIKGINLDPRLFTGHSFRRGGATFAFQAHVPGEMIKLTGDWSSDAYLKYLDFSLSDKLGVSRAMQHMIRQLAL